jgi:hypothetical protein
MGRDINDEYLSNEEDTARRRQADTYGFVPPPLTGYCRRMKGATNCGKPTKGTICRECADEMDRNLDEVPF